MNDYADEEDCCLNLNSHMADLRDENLLYHTQDDKNNLTGGFLRLF